LEGSVLSGEVATLAPQRATKPGLRFCAPRGTKNVGRCRGFASRVLILEIRGSEGRGKEERKLAVALTRYRGACREACHVAVAKARDGDRGTANKTATMMKALRQEKVLEPARGMCVDLSPR
jgi:hypothetical protein